MPSLAQELDEGMSLVTAEEENSAGWHLMNLKAMHCALHTKFTYSTPTIDTLS